jgi:hypothetical protein
MWPTEQNLAKIYYQLTAEFKDIMETEFQRFATVLLKPTTSLPTI